MLTIIACPNRYYPNDEDEIYSKSSLSHLSCLNVLNMFNMFNAKPYTKCILSLNNYTLAACLMLP